MFPRPLSGQRPRGGSGTGRAVPGGFPPRPRAHGPAGERPGVSRCQQHAVFLSKGSSSFLAGQWLRAVPGLIHVSWGCVMAGTSPRDRGLCLPGAMSPQTLRPCAPEVLVVVTVAVTVAVTLRRSWSAVPCTVGRTQEATAPGSSPPSSLSKSHRESKVNKVQKRS